jgi:GalNAc-alpha-(1->4)-GalNAc-alpha-(1->3)-diNAcBac-PP-undecaprenol alpha-1,4-N-acetyl-D-galactosaminyltransferase
LKPRHLALITPSLAAGGAERVIAQLANYLSRGSDLKITVVSLVTKEKFYSLPANVDFIEPDFQHQQFSRFVFTVKTFNYLRKKLKLIKPDVLLSFGGKYNSFVLLAAYNSGIRCFVSDRSRPTISYGKLLDFLNGIVYRTAYGIVAQTSISEKITRHRIGHPNIATIGNPITLPLEEPLRRENIILNVGRFIPSKHQRLLVEYFAAVRTGNWKLILVGDGDLMQETKKKALDLGIAEYVEFPGLVKNVSDYYKKARIFAFTSTSEGFPNALAEALATPLACISFNCIAGPSDLIEDGVSGFLVHEMDHDKYKQRLRVLMEDESQRRSFEAEARSRISNYSIEKIGAAYLNFLTRDRNGSSD